MNRINQQTGIKVFLLLMLVGMIGGLIDGVAYLVHLHSHNVGFFSMVPRNILWSYVKTFPGNLLTVLWLIPWIAAFLWLSLGEKIGDIQFENREQGSF